MLRAGRVGFTHAGNAPSWERLDAHACGVCGMYLFGCSAEARNHVRRTLVSTRSDACAHESTGTTYRRWLRCDTVTAESPAPAMSCRHTGQMCCSDMLHIFRYRLVAAARMLTVRSSADTRTNTARGRHLGPPRGRSPRRVYVAGTRAEDQTALRTQNQPPTLAQLYSPTETNA